MNAKDIHPNSGVFGIIFYSKVKDEKSFETYSDNLRDFFKHLAQPELVRGIYFVDDSERDYQGALRHHLSSLSGQACPFSKIVSLTNSGNIYNAVNQVWSRVREEYVISFHEDFRLIQTLSLRTVKKAFEKYSEVYLVYLRVRGLFGYNDEVKQELKRRYPWYSDYDDEVKETWFCREDQDRIFSIPHELYVKQEKSLLPQDFCGVELVPRSIDTSNTLWTPRLPSQLLPTRPACESFAGGPVIFRTGVVQRYLPLPKEYEHRSPAQCLETYFWTTDIDYKFYTGYLNLQAFAIAFEDPKRPLQNYSREYWQHFLMRNSQPMIESEPDSWRHVLEARLLRRLHALLLTRHRRLMKQEAARQAGVLRSLARRIIKQSP
ncbi:MAG: hypothetical protein V3U24_05170 [Candidatus Neomarinimicrobiota bacterium]